MGRCALPVVNQWWFCIPVGIALGFLSGLGVGGGSLLMLWLTQVAGAGHEQARVMNLMFFIPCAAIASVFRWKQMSADRSLILTAVGCGLLGALAGNFLNSRLDMELMQKGLGALFLVCGIRELFYRDRKAR